MQQDKLGLLIRQIKDIQAQADKILKGNDGSEEIETFAKYSEELKHYILKHVDAPKIRAYMGQVPAVDYESPRIQIWQYLIFPSWWMVLYNDRKEKERILEDISLVRGKYATLELYVRELTY